MSESEGTGWTELCNDQLHVSNCPLLEVNAVVGRVARIGAVRCAHVIFVNRKRSGRTFEGSDNMSLTGKRLSVG